ncbi:Thioredoxin F2, chloroplastic [Morella rubra]|uniref:Thioredoxin F2, chloroplastic n=1 Tax=Morella rubra TaxID=262757 RepID=A0A6A1USW3_9ROSI|nr:Thioredoxin F2, chloroplastic [Morella rubra]
MALNLTVSSPPIRYPQPLPSSVRQPIALLSTFVSSDSSITTAPRVSYSYPKASARSSSGFGKEKSRRAYRSTVVRSSLDTVGPTVQVGQVTEVDKDNFWPLVKAAGDKTVVLDMYTQCVALDDKGNFKGSENATYLAIEEFFKFDAVFLQGVMQRKSQVRYLAVIGVLFRCGPCKVMAPKFQELSKKYLDVVFLKLDCNQENKPLAKELGIRVVPTFKILKENKVVKEVTGAKFDDLVLAIDTVRSG